MSNLQNRLSQYAEERELDLVERLGDGTDGLVWSSNNNTAIKAFERERNYANELQCYQRLRDHDVSDICGFRVPCLVANSDELLIVEMDIVSPPRVLDFAKAYVDYPPQRMMEMRDAERETIEENFGDNAYQVKVILFALESHGIYYFDVKPQNIRFA